MPLLRRLPLLWVAVLVLVTGCASVVAGSPVAEDTVMRTEADTSILRGGDGGEVDKLAAATVTDLQAFWSQAFERSFGRPWQDLRGGFYSIDTTDRAAPPPPCVDDVTQVEGNAYYCSEADVVVWDRNALLPVLRDEFSDAAVVMVLAHEVGHAVHHRLGLDIERQLADLERFPTILTEAMADCYAGAFLRWVVDGNAEHLAITSRQLDSALGALITFRDPVGFGSADMAAHGNAFDRVSAFQDGYDRGPQLCAGMTVDNRRFTLQRFTSLEDQARGGNLPFGELLDAIGPDLATFFDRLVAARGGAWRPPILRASPDDPDCGTQQGPVAFCADTASAAGEVHVDTDGELRELHDELGDYAAGVLVASRYGLAAVAALGRPVQGEGAGRQALCLAGSYTGEVLSRTEGFGLSPGDLDEAVQVLLRTDYGGRDASGAATGSGFQRVVTFRSGALDGPAGCGLR